MVSVGISTLKQLAHEFRVLKRSRDLAQLHGRWKRRLMDDGESSGSQKGKPVFDRISVNVINLERRQDRLQRVSENLRLVGIKNWNRTNAVDGKKLFDSLGGLLAASVGCELSHIAALASAAAGGYEAIMICEDDLEFVAEPTEIASVIEEFLNNPHLDVLSVSGRPRGVSIAISGSLRVVTGVVGRGCYIVKPHVVAPLITIFSEGLSIMSRGDASGKGDLMWRPAQKTKYFFSFPIRDLAQQSSGFSDIEGRHLGPR